MLLDAFTVVSEPRRRAILDELRRGPASVNELVEQLGWTQPSVSKHLRVLRLNGFVSSRTAAQRRVYSLNVEPLGELDAWLRPYREMWDTSFRALATHLDQVDVASRRAAEAQTVTDQEHP